MGKWIGEESINQGSWLQMTEESQILKWTETKQPMHWFTEFEKTRVYPETQMLMLIER